MLKIKMSFQQMSFQKGTGFKRVLQSKRKLAAPREPFPEEEPLGLWSGGRRWGTDLSRAMGGKLVHESMNQAKI